MSRKRDPNRDPFSQALGYAHRLLSIKERSQNEIERRLKEKGHDREYVAKVIEHLRARRLLDDERLAREWVKASSTSRPKPSAAWASFIIPVTPPS